MLIEVTQGDIDSGEKWSCTDCPIALAVQRKLGLGAGGFGVQVGRRAIDLEDGSFLTMPEKATQFTLDFDNGKPVQPFTFESR